MYQPVYICISLYHSYILAEEVFNWLITLAFATLVYALKYLSLSNINNSLSLSRSFYITLTARTDKYSPSGNDGSIG